MKLKIVPLITILGTGAWSLSSQAQVLVNETFDYADTTAMLLNWSGGGSGAGGTLNTEAGLSAPSGAHDGTASFHVWSGPAFSVTPTDAAPLVLSGDLWFSGTGGQRNTIGLRTGADPLFEIGFYNQAGANGLSARILNFAGNENWIELASYTSLGAGQEQWIRFEATFAATTLNIRWDLGADGTWDGLLSSSGANATGVFSDLRFGGPSGVSSAGGSFLVDNIKLEVVPEPATAALLGLGLSGLLAWRRSRR